MCGKRQFPSGFARAPAIQLESPLGGCAIGMANLGGGGQTGCAVLLVVPPSISKPASAGFFTCRLEWTSRAQCFLRSRCDMARRQPAVLVFAGAVDDAEERLLQLLGDRAAAALADRDLVDRDRKSVV